MKCKNCGFEFEQGEKFCTNCGAKLETGETVEASKLETEKDLRDHIKVKWYYSALFIIVVSISGLYFIPFSFVAAILLILRFRSMKGKKKSIPKRIVNGVLIFWVIVYIIGNPLLFPSDTESVSTVQTEDIGEFESSTQDYSNVFPTKTEAYTIFTAIYPKKFSKERKELFEVIKEFDGLNVTDLNAIVVDLGKGETYTRTISGDGYYYYSGNLNKNNQPDGVGIFWRNLEWMDNNFKLPVFVGHFKDGKIDGYGIQFGEGGILLEGNFDKKMRLQGEGIFYYDRDQHDEASKELKDYIEWREDAYGTLYLSQPVLQPSVCYEGEFKNGKYCGKGKLYRDLYVQQTSDVDAEYVRDGEGCYGRIQIEGEFDNNLPSGKVIEYRQDGGIQYEGEMKDGLYHGKGKLYDNAGTLIHKGKFRYGDID